MGINKLFSTTAGLLDNPFFPFLSEDTLGTDSSDPAQPFGTAAFVSSHQIVQVPDDSAAAVDATCSGVRTESLSLQAQDLQAWVQPAATLIRIDQVHSDPLFAGVDGHGQTIVIIDSGADLDHSFFGASSNGVSTRILYQHDFVGAGDNDASDGNGHGTHVAGIIGSQDPTYTGMAPGCNLIVLRILNDAGNGTFADLEEAWQWVVANRASYNIVGVNMSVGVSSNFNSDQATAISDEVQTLWDSGIASVIAAGNDYTSFNAPGVQSLAATANAWGVASTLDNANAFSYFSQRSSTMTEIAAPGSNITSAYLNNGIATLSGTSMAAPMISGLLALAQDLSQEITGGTKMTPASILNIMRTTGVGITDGSVSVPRVDAVNLMKGVVSFWQQSSANADHIFGWRGDDILFGQGGDDIIHGNAGNDIIDGGEGIDTLSGEAGIDTFQSTMSGLYGDTITDLSAGEEIVFTDAGANFTFSRNGTTLSYGNGLLQYALTLSNDPIGQFVQSPHVGGGVELTLQPVGSVSISNATAVEGDSGTNVMAFTITRTGGAAAFSVNFSTLDNSATVADHDYAATAGTLQFGAGENTKIVSVAIFGDSKFEGDESFYLILSNATNGGTISGGVGTGTITNDDTVLHRVAQWDANWQPVATGDFNTDGTTDVIWDNRHGVEGGWLMSDGRISGTLQLPFFPDWRPVGSGDFNKDGASDILWQNSNGLVGLWFMGEGTRQATATLENMAGWHVAAEGDFNKDGVTDIIWSSSDDVLGGWLMGADGQIAGTIELPFFPGWTAIAAGDYNHDGNTDILWRNADGLVAEWLMGNGTRQGTVAIQNLNLAGWSAIAGGDFNGDGTADVLWRNTEGVTAAWFMKDGQISQSRDLGSTAQWAFVTSGDFNNDGVDDIMWQNVVTGEVATWHFDRDGLLI